MVIEWTAMRFLPTKLVGLEVNTIIGDVMGLWNSKNIELSGRLHTAIEKSFYFFITLRCEEAM